MPLTDLIIEMDLGEPILDSQDRPILDSQDRIILDSDWVSVTSDAVQDPIHIRRGIFSTDFKDRVADTGTLTLTLNNSAANSAGLMGYYSLDHANRRAYFGNSTRARINMKRASDYYKFQGRLSDIQIEAGLLNPKRTYVTVADWMDVAARTPMPKLPILQNVRDDQVIQTILNAISEAPFETSLALGGYAYPYALTDVREGDTKIIGVLSSLMLSGLGRVFVKGGPTSGEILTYIDIYWQVNLDEQAPIAVFNDSMLKTTAQRKAFQRIKRATVRVYPMQSDGVLVTLYNLSTSIRIPAGEAITFTGTYTDPNTGRSVSALDARTPVADDDYKFSSLDGVGNDLNGDLVVEQFSTSTNSASVTLRNTGVQDGYLWFYRVQGYALYSYDALDYTIADDTIPEAEGGTYEYQMPYQGDYNVARDYGRMFLYWLGIESTNMPTIEFNGGQNTKAIDWAVEAEPGTLVEVSESVTGISRLFMVLGYDMEIRSKNDIPVTLYVTPVLSGSFCKLDVVGLAELDTNAILGV